MAVTLLNPYLQAASGPFTPASVPGLVQWLEADAITGLSDGDPVGTWADLSGNGNNVIQATGSKKPLYKTGILNGLPVLRFDGVDDYLAGSLVSAQPYTRFVVVKFTVSTGLFDAIDGGTINEGAIGYYFATTFRMFGGNPVDIVSAAGGFRILSAVFNGASSLLALDGAVTTRDAGTSGTTGISIGIAGDHLNLPLNGDVAAVLTYAAAPSTGEREDIEGYFSDKYAIAV